MNKTGIAREERKKGDIEIGIPEIQKCSKADPHCRQSREIQKESVFTRRIKEERGGQGKRRGKDKEGEVGKKGSTRKEGEFDKGRENDKRRS